MKTPQIISMTFTKTNVDVMHRTDVNVMDTLLSFITENSSTKLITRTEFNIKYNPFGGYYNLHIHVWSKRDGNFIRAIIKLFNEMMKERMKQSLKKALL